MTKDEKIDELLAKLADYIYPDGVCPNPEYYHPDFCCDCNACRDINKEEWIKNEKMEVIE